MRSNSVNPGADNCLHCKRQINFRDLWHGIKQVSLGHCSFCSFENISCKLHFYHGMYFLWVLSVPPTTALAPGLQEKSMLKSVLVNNGILTRLLIDFGWSLCCRAIRGPVLKCSANNMDFNMEISWYSGQLVLTHRRQVTHLCVHKNWAIINVENGLFLAQCETVVLINYNLSFIVPLETNLKEI